MKEPKERSGALSPELAKLTEKLAKDPKSKLFLPLAEEYLRLGMLDEAEMVLRDGLTTHPTFLSARVALGKVCLQKGAPVEAQAEFEAVIRLSPDNFWVQRRLARIYADTGQWQAALNCCSVVLGANPKDTEMVQLRAEMQARRPPEMAPAPAPPVAGSAVETPLAVAATESPELDAAAQDAFMASLMTDLESPPPIAVPSAAGDSSSIQAEPPGPTLPAAVVEAAAVIAGDDQEDRSVTLPSDTGTLEEILAELGVRPAAPGTPSIETIATPNAGDGAAAEILSESLGDLYVQQGFYQRGIEIYQKLLAQAPERESLVRKLDETRGWLQDLPRPPAAPAVSDDAIPAPSPPMTAVPVDPSESGPRIPASAPPLEGVGPELLDALAAPPDSAPVAEGVADLLASLTGSESVAAAAAETEQPLVAGMQPVAVAAAPETFGPRDEADDRPPRERVPSERAQGRRRKIERLQAWLDSLRRGAGR